MSPSRTLSSAAPPGAAASRRATIVLFLIVTCQLMVVLDASVVNIALPNIQHDLGLSATNLSWVLNAYTLTFGGLLLLGGRAGDLLGRRRMFVGGLVVFTAASFLGGLATTGWWLLAARALQGIGAAFAAPSALALITTTFAEGAPRNRALGVFSAMSATGASIGLILGGVLTDAASWRWVMFINVPFGIALVLLAPRFIVESERHPGRFDLQGALTGTLGISALVYGFIRVASTSWSNGPALAIFAVAAVLVAAFVLIERRASQPILPLRLLVNRTRTSGFLIMLLLAGAMFSMFFFLSQFLQDVLGMSPLTAGVAFLPLTTAIFVMSQTMPRVLPRTGPRPLLLIGLSSVVIGLVWLTQLSPGSTYLGGLLGPMLFFGTGAGMCFMPLTTMILSAVRREDSGAVSGALQTMQQTGGALGVAVLVSVFAAARRNAAEHPLHPSVAEAHATLAHGMTSAFTVAAIFATVALLVAAVLLRPAQPRGGGGLATAPEAAG